MNQKTIRENLQAYLCLACVLTLVALVAPISTYQFGPLDQTGQRAAQTAEWLGGWITLSRTTQYGPQGEVVESSGTQLTFQPRLRPLLWLLLVAGLLAACRVIGQDWSAVRMARWKYPLAVTVGSLVKGGLCAGLLMLVLGLIGPRPIVYEWRSMDAAMLERVEPALAESAAANAWSARTERDVDAAGMTVLRARRHDFPILSLVQDSFGWTPGITELNQAQLSVHMPMPRSLLWVGGFFGLLVFGRALRLALRDSGSDGEAGSATPAGA